MLFFNLPMMSSVHAVDLTSPPALTAPMLTKPPEDLSYPQPNRSFRIAVNPGPATETEIDDARLAKSKELGNIGSTAEIKGVLISANEREVVYRFHSANSVNVAITDLTKDFDMVLLDSVGIPWGVSSNPGTTPESISLANLPEDDYYVRIYKPSNDNAAGTFTIRASNNDPTNLIARENPNILELQTTLTFSGAVGERDTSDIFRFKVSNALVGKRIRFRLEGLTKNANLRVIKENNQSGNRSGIIDNNEILGESSNSSSTPEEVTITAPVAGDDYFVQISGFPRDDVNQSQGTRYKLTITRL